MQATKTSHCSNVISSQPAEAKKGTQSSVQQNAAVLAWQADAVAETPSGWLEQCVAAHCVNTVNLLLVIPCWDLVSIEHLGYADAKEFRS